MVTVCDSCIEALEEEGAPEGAEAQMAVEMGADIADHLCDEIESDGDIRCTCACHPRKRSASWSGKAKDFTPKVVEETYRKVYD
jgi:hypothetical protein